MKQIGSIVFGESIDLQINKSVQKVYFNGFFVGFMTSKLINYLSPLTEFFISVDLTKDQLYNINGYRIDDSENKGYWNVCLNLDSNKDYSDLKCLCEKIYTLLNN